MKYSRILIRLVIIRTTTIINQLIQIIIIIQNTNMSHTNKEHEEDQKRERIIRC